MYAMTTASAKRLHPIIYSTLSMEGMKGLVNRHYDLDEPVECTFVSRSVSDTYRLSTPAQSFALKVYRTNWRARAIPPTQSGIAAARANRTKTSPKTSTRMIPAEIHTASPNGKRESL